MKKAVLSYAVPFVKQECGRNKDESSGFKRFSVEFGSAAGRLTERRAKKCVFLLSTMHKGGTIPELIGIALIE
jgi:hypothetical protein